MNDEDQIRALVANWMSATQQGDVNAVMRLMTDDVVFLRSGKAPMRRAEFEAAARAQAAGNAPRFEGRSDIQQIQVCGDWAFMWSKLVVTATPSDGHGPTTRSGHTLTIFRKQAGRWLLARDANMLSPASGPEDA
jgi:uncharacterized protein (TIGR02246 family)